MLSSELHMWIGSSGEQGCGQGLIKRQKPTHSEQEYSNVRNCVLEFFRETEPMVYVYKQIHFK